MFYMHDLSYFSEQLQSFLYRLPKFTLPVCGPVKIPSPGASARSKTEARLECLFWMGWKGREGGVRDKGRQMKGGGEIRNILGIPREHHRGPDFQKTEGGCFWKIKRRGPKKRHLYLVAQRVLVALKAVSEKWWSLKSVGRGGSNRWGSGSHRGRLWGGLVLNSLIIEKTLWYIIMISQL